MLAHLHSVKALVYATCDMNFCTGVTATKKEYTYLRQLNNVGFIFIYSVKTIISTRSNTTFRRLLVTYGKIFNNNRIL